MPIFAHIETEYNLQLEDRTRLDASKSHTTLNQPPFTTLTIQPGLDTVPYNVYNSDKNKRYLDWEFSTWNIDIDSSNNKLDFKENAGALVATLASGTYTLYQLATQIQTQLNASTTQPLVYTVSINIDNDIIISSTGTFSLLIATGANRLVSIYNNLFFGSEDLTGASSYTSETIQYLQKKIICYAGEDTYQIQKVNCGADVSGSLNSKYFVIYANADALKFYCWYNVSAGGVDPALPGFTGIEVIINTNDTSTAVATATASAIDGSASFSATSSTNAVTFTHVTANWNTPAQEGLGTGFTFLILTQGEAQDIEFTYLHVYSVNGDYLFSNDPDLMQFEPDIRKWISDGRNSFLNIHRQAQKHILEWLDREGYTNTSGDIYTKYDFLNISEVFEWSRFVALRMIFEGIKSSKDDVFEQKKKDYSDREVAARDRAILRIRITPTNTMTTPLQINNSTSLFRS